MKKILLYSLLLINIPVVFAQNSLENMGILIPKELKEWEFTKDHLDSNELFKNAEDVKAFITQHNEPVKIYQFYKYHPESNVELIPKVTFYIFPNLLPVGDYPKMVTDFFNKNQQGLTNIKNVVNETFLNGNSPEYVQHYSYKEQIMLNKKRTDVNVNMVQSLIFKPEYILFIDAYQPIEPKYDSPKIYNEREKEEMVKMIKEIKIKETVIIE